MQGDEVGEEDNGFVQLKNLIPKKEFEELSLEYDRLFKRKNEAKTESSWVGSDDSNRQSDSPYSVKGIHNLQYHHSIFGKILYNENILDALEDIMETENIALHHTKAHYKPPEKGAAYPMHQDYPYFPYQNDSMVAAFIHLDAASPENGGLFVYPGSHKLGPQEDFGPKEGSNFHYVDQKKFPLSGATPVIAEAGDVVIFSYLLIHGSTPNNSTRPRRMLLIQYADAHDKPNAGERGQPGRGLILRGVCLDRDATVANRHQIA
ncbi:probable alpha-ketoglutarate-dependent hypophosphite dioxygenase isoform X2 [Epargyreus clarus]|uniref:probable alpha-ketoglutarate-dependent hypophosphite dioxygenase isoform X2 n=1 Tax=Epargyreus clarus TaxID=520877 RepID=UPI003C2ADF5D